MPATKIMPKSEKKAATPRKAPVTRTGNGVVEATRKTVTVPKDAKVQLVPNALNDSSALMCVAFQDAELQKEFQAYCQANYADSREIAPALAFLRTEIEFIDNAEFGLAKSEKEVFGCRLFDFSQDTADGRSVKLSDMPVHLARLCETKLLKPEEERLLFCRLNFLRCRAEMLRREAVAKDQLQDYAIAILSLMRAADWYRDAIVKANMRLVISIVKKFVNANNNFEDLLSDGIIALIRAVDKFDFDRGFRFSTYATQVVRRNAYRNVMTKQKEKLQVTSSLSEGNVDVSDEAKSSSMSESRWHELRSRLSTMLDTLDKREKLIIRARFSLGGHRNVKTLQCLADRLGVSKERVRQLEKRSLDKLREMAGHDFKLIDSTDVDTED